MAVRTTTATLYPPRGDYTDPIRPPFDFVDVLDETRYDRTTWYYPWQGTGYYATTRLTADNSNKAKWLNYRGTLDRLPIVRRAGRARMKTFTDLFYGRLQLNPSYLNLGNILNSQTREVELWNASFAPVTVQQVIRQNDDGIDLDIPVSVPFVLAPLQAITIDVGISTTGPTNMDARFTFDAVQLGDVTLQVVGTRAVVFSLMPDTSKSYLEKLTWVSSMITSIDGTEQRAALNENPDTQITMTVQQHREKIHNLDSLLWGWQHRIYSLPLWHRHSNLSEAAYAAGTTVMCTTAYAGFRVGGTAILWADYDYFETFEITEIQADRLIAKRPLQRDWGRGTLVAACRPARLPQQVDANWQHADLADVQLTFVLTEVEEETPYEFPLSYRGTPLLMIAPNWVSPLTEQNVRNLDVFETDLKARFTVLNNDVPYVVRAHAWFLKGKGKIDQFRRWLYSRRGRVVPFWSPSWKADLRLVTRIEQGAVTIEVANIGYRNFYATPTGRQDIVIFLRNGQTLLRRITGASQGVTSATEVLALDQEISQVIEPNAVQMISFLGLNRLDADEVELDWRSDQLALANQNMRLLTDGV